MGARFIPIALGALALAALAGPASAACKLLKVAEAPVTMAGLAPVIPAKVGSTDAHLEVDSGAFFSMLTPDGARRLGLRIGSAPPGLYVRGVNGDASVGLATAKDITLLGYPFHNVDFLVAGGQIGGGRDGWLGQNFLNAFDVEYDFANGVMRLFKPQGCSDTALAYWAQGRSFSVITMQRSENALSEIIHPIMSTDAMVNGTAITVIFDTGAWRSTLTTRAAARAGVRPAGPGVTPEGVAGGFGRRAVETWVAPFDSFAIGDEQIKNTRLRIGDIDLQNADMLLGADFFLSHRIYVANSQHRIYFTYNGGPVFRLEDTPQPLAQSAAPPSAPAAASAPARADEPKSAAEFSRRGAAFMARRDIDHALADFARAVELEPNDPQHYFDRANAHAANRQPYLAMGDLDQALKLKPDFVPALLLRGQARLAGRDVAGARQDFDAAVRADPKARLRVAMAYEVAGQLDQAITEVDQWIAANPKADDMPTALNNRCWARALLGHELDKALADCDAALKLAPHTPGFLDSRGLVRLRLGQLDGAIADYNEALKVEPNLAWSLYGRGLAKLKKGMKAEGDADIAAATAIAPRLPEEAKRYGVTP
jgi:tetratricopeptide (TPR) repeat protein/predicted aspartyl protease